MHAQLQELENKILAKMAEMQGKSAREAAASLGQTLQNEGVVGVTEEQVHRIVKLALQRYSEDRIGMVDYALESGGVCCLHHFTLPWSLHWLGPRSARQQC